MNLSKVQCSVPRDMHTKMCLLADKQGVKVSTLYRNIMSQWYQDNFREYWSFWHVYGNQEEL